MFYLSDSEIVGFVCDGGANVVESISVSLYSVVIDSTVVVVIGADVVVVVVVVVVLVVDVVSMDIGSMNCVEGFCVDNIFGTEFNAGRIGARIVEENICGRSVIKSKSLS